MRVDAGDIRLTPAAASDADALASLRVVAMRESLERVGRFDEARARNRLLSGFSAQHTRHIELDGQRVGFVVLVPRGEALALEHFYIHPKAQRLGVGSAVLSLVFSEADRLGAAIEVGALRDSESNEFYTRHGFRLTESSEFDHYYVRKPRSRP